MIAGLSAKGKGGDHGSESVKKPAGTVHVGTQRGDHPQHGALWVPAIILFIRPAEYPYPAICLRYLGTG